MALLVAGMAWNTVYLRAFYKFLFDAAKDQRFSAALVLSEDKAMGIHEDFINRQLIRYYAVMAMQSFMIGYSQRLNFIMSEPEFGPGRIDTFSPAKALLNFPTTPNTMPQNQLTGTPDFPPTWHQRNH